MRYEEPKARSAEVLRVALGHMGQHRAAFNPMTFAVWYEYAAGINSPLHAAVEKLLNEQLEIDDEAIQRLYQGHIAPNDEAEVTRISSEFEKVMTGIATTASQTGERAGVFGGQLEDLSAALSSGGASGLYPRLSVALAGTDEMKRSALALEQQVAASQSEIMRLRAELDRARGEALRDPLTGVLNRKGLDEVLDTMIATPCPAGHAHCLILLDVDHFKKVNDAHGHLIGDRVLQGLGAILRQSAVGANLAAARFGGEEFALVCQHATLEAAVQLAEQVRLRARGMKVRHRGTQEVLVTVTVSAGVTAMRPGDDSASLIARADSALYRAKAEGRDRVSRG